jgi:hypothetical protein
MLIALGGDERIDAWLADDVGAEDDLTLLRDLLGEALVAAEQALAQRQKERRDGARHDDD